jgi:hypothetical protein
MEAKRSALGSGTHGNHLPIMGAKRSVLAGGHPNHGAEPRNAVPWEAAHTDATV